MSLEVMMAHRKDGGNISVFALYGIIAAFLLQREHTLDKEDDKCPPSIETITRTVVMVFEKLLVNCYDFGMKLFFHFVHCSQLEHPKPDNAWVQLTVTEKVCSWIHRNVRDDFRRLDDASNNRISAAASVAATYATDQLDDIAKAADSMFLGSNQGNKDSDSNVSGNKDIITLVDNHCEDDDINANNAQQSFSPKDTKSCNDEEQFLLILWKE